MQHHCILMIKSPDVRQMSTSDILTQILDLMMHHSYKILAKRFGSDIKSLLLQFNWHVFPCVSEVHYIEEIFFWDFTSFKDFYWQINHMYAKTHFLTQPNLLAMTLLLINNNSTISSMHCWFSNIGCGTWNSRLLSEVGNTHKPMITFYEGNLTLETQNNHLVT